MYERIRRVHDSGIRPGGEYVLYWLRFNRRAESNHALAFAAELANRLDLPLLVYERLACHRSANDRHHTFVLEGVPDLAAGLKDLGARYLFHLERRPVQSHKLLSELIRTAAALVTDDYPDLVAARYGDELPPNLDLETYLVDSSCIVPMRTIGDRLYAAYSMRPKVRAALSRFLKPLVPVKLKVPLHREFAEHTEVAATDIPQLVAGCAIDHSVRPSTSFRGGRKEAERRLKQFLKTRLHRYSADKNEPSAHVTSDLSPYLHWGQISSLEVALAVRSYASEHKLMATEFLEELIVRRELAFNFSCYTPAVDNLEVLPDWARSTMKTHASDTRDPVYTPAELEAGATYDELWNATQSELKLRGKIHGYYRMFWGKKIIEWSETYAQALDTMIGLHDKYAVDGRDPNTFTNILWCFGLHDRPWPERAIYGTIRSMVRSGMDRKTDTAAYIREIDYLKRTGKEINP